MGYVGVKVEIGSRRRIESRDTTPKYVVGAGVYREISHEVTVQLRCATGAEAIALLAKAIHPHCNLPQGWTAY